VKKKIWSFPVVKVGAVLPGQDTEPGQVTAPEVCVKKSLNVYSLPLTGGLLKVNTLAPFIVFVKTLPMEQSISNAPIAFWLLRTAPFVKILPVKVGLAGLTGVKPRAVVMVPEEISPRIVELDLFSTLPNPRVARAVAASASSIRVRPKALANVEGRVRKIVGAEVKVTIELALLDFSTIVRAK
jgi:hypothetical protein